MWCEGRYVEGVTNPTDITDLSMLSVNVDMLAVHKRTRNKVTRAFACPETLLYNYYTENHSEKQ